jgi:hypothetical protein
MKAIVVSLAAGAALAFAPSVAVAAPPPSQTHQCRPSQPAFTALVASSTVSCREARAMNSFMMRHETLSGGFMLRGKVWRGTVYSRADDQTAMVYRHGAQRIWITYGGEAS